MWKALSEGDIVDIVAPGNGGTPDQLEKAHQALQTWGLVGRESPDIMGPDLLYANSDAKRFQDLKRALYAEDSAAVWTLRGGSGSTRLIPQLATLKPLKREKLFIGLSDITCLHIFLHQVWGWSPIHGPALARMEELTPETVELIRGLVFGDCQNWNFANVTDLNQRPGGTIHAPITGGNLSLIQYSIGTSWQIQTAGKILFCEDINERAYRTAERLEQMKQAGLFRDCLAIVFSDFTFPVPNPVEQDLHNKMVQRFADQTPIPVLSCPGIGHGPSNLAVPIGSNGRVTLGIKPEFGWSI